MVETAVPGTVFLKRKAIGTLFSYAVSQEREGRHEMFSTFLRVAKVLVFLWHHLDPLVVALLAEESPIPLKRVAILTLPHTSWWVLPGREHQIQPWVAAASAVPYSDDIGRSVVDTLLLIAHLDPLSPHIPVGMWSWLNKRPSLYPICVGRFWGSQRNVLRRIRALGDIKILVSYLLLVWSEWDSFGITDFYEMCTSIREDFSGPQMEDHRQDLLRRLDYVLRRLDLGLEHYRQHKPGLSGGDIQQMKAQYGKLKILLEVDQRARGTKIRELSMFVTLLSVLTPVGVHRT